MRAYVRIQHPGGVAELTHGDIIGRVWTAALQIDDARVSEAHAMVSLREGELRLLSLRGAFAVSGKPLREVALQPGLVVQLARGLSFEVTDVALPESILGLEGPDLPAQPLPGVCSLVLDPTPRISSRYEDGASARLWTTGDGWRMQMGDAPPRSLGIGDAFEVEGHTFTAVGVSLGRASQTPTRMRDRVEAPIRIVAEFDTVQILREGTPVLLLSGILARLISELVVLDGPVSWSNLGSLLWPNEPEAGLVRARLDTTLSRLRRKLRTAQIRSDLVRTDGAGQVTLNCYDHDTIEDRT